MLRQSRPGMPIAWAATRRSHIDLVEQKQAVNRSPLQHQLQHRATFRDIQGRSWHSPSLGQCFTRRQKHP